MVVAVSVAFHIHIVFFKHGQGFLDGGRTVEQHTYGSRCAYAWFTCVLLCLILFQRKDAYGKAVFVDTVEGSVGQSHQQGEVGFAISIKSLTVT